MSEKEVIQLCQSGQLNYFTPLYEKYVDEIYRFIYLKTYDVYVTQDLCSQVFFKCLEKIKQFKVDKPNANFRAWLYRIAYHLIVDTYKGKKETIDISEILEIGYQTNFGENLDNKEKIKEVLQYFDTLNTKHKEILIMRLWDDLSYKEISEITGESIDNCKKIVSRTLKNIPISSLSFFIMLFGTKILFLFYH